MMRATVGLLLLASSAFATTALAQTSGTDTTGTPGAPLSLSRPAGSPAPGAILVQPLPAPTGTGSTAAPAPGAIAAPITPAPAAPIPATPAPAATATPAAEAPPLSERDRAAESGTLLVTAEAGLGPTIPLVAENGFPFDVLLSVDTTECVQVLPADCGPVVRDRLVRTHTRQIVYTVRRVDVTHPSSVALRFFWAPADPGSPDRQ